MWYFWPIYLLFRSLADRYAMTPLFLLFSLTSRVIVHQMVQRKDSRGASFTFEAVTAISTIRSRLFFPPIVLARGSVHIEKQFSQLQGHIRRQVRDILVKSSQRNVEGKVISPKRRTCSFERNGGWCGPTHVKSPCSVIPWPQGCATPHACSLNTRVVADHVKTGSAVARYFCRFVKPARWELCRPTVAFLSFIVVIMSDDGTRIMVCECEALGYGFSVWKRQWKRRFFIYRWQIVDTHTHTHIQSIANRLETF